MSSEWGSGVIGRVAATGVAAGAMAVGSVYWRHMSPYSQALGQFPYQMPARAGDLYPVALTFDDGPNEPYTSQIVAVLADRGVPATFFVVGRCAQRHPGVARDLVEAGHVVGNHSFSHTFSSGWTVDRVRREVLGGQDVLTDELGMRPLLYRPPWLIRTAGLFAVLKEQGLSAISGEFCHPLEPFQPSARLIARHALTTATPGGILIFHDGCDDRGGNRSNTVEAVKIVVDALLDSGAQFGTVDEMLGVTAYERFGSSLRG